METLKKVSVLLIISISLLVAQNYKIVDAEFKVSGNCNQCKTRIENAVKIKEVKYAKWNKSNKILKVKFENSISIDSLHVLVANAGHNTEKFNANADTYSTLPKCCLYRNNPKTH